MKRSLFFVPTRNHHIYFHRRYIL